MNSGSIVISSFLKLYKKTMWLVDDAIKIIHTYKVYPDSIYSKSGGIFGISSSSKSLTILMELAPALAAQSFHNFDSEALDSACTFLEKINTIKKNHLPR